MFYAKETVYIGSGKKGISTIHIFDTKTHRDLFVERKRRFKDTANSLLVTREDVSKSEADIFIAKHGRSCAVKHSFVVTKGVVK